MLAAGSGRVVTIRGRSLDASVTGPPIVWLALPAAARVHDERIVARDFAAWFPHATEDPMPGSDPALTRRVWRALFELALDRDRKIAVADALGLSWTRVLAPRRLAIESRTQRDLAHSLSADPPYITLVVDDLEKRGLVRRTPHPSDRRAKLVELTASGRAAAARADAILDEPPAALHEVRDSDLRGVLRVLEHLARS